MANQNTAQGRGSNNTNTVKTASGKKGHKPVPPAHILAAMAMRNMR